MSKDLISVIIPTYNEEKNIENTIRLVKSQTYPNLELIIVDNGSTDKTINLASKYCGSIYTLKERNVSKAKNLGAEKAKGDLIAFLDADISIREDLLEKSYKKIKEGDIAAICPIKTYGGNIIGDKIFDLMNGCILLGTIVKIPRGFLLIHKETFEDMHLNHKVFREDLILGEDLHCGEIMKKYGKIGIVDSMNKTLARRQIKQGYLNVAFEWFKAFYNHKTGQKVKINY